MKSLAIVMGMMLAFAWAAASSPGQDEKKLIAHGTYSMEGTDNTGAKKVVKLDEWRMFSNKDGSNSVEIEMDAQMKIEEHYVLTNDLKPTAFSWAVSNKNGGGQSITISCDFGSEKVACRTLEDGVNSSAVLAQKVPYIFMPTAEAPSLDLPWFFQTMAAQAGRISEQTSAIPLITIEDGDTPNSIALKVQEIEHVSYAGREKIEVAGQTVLAHKFQLTETGTAAPENLWLSDSGLLLRMSQENSSFVLTNYEGPSLDQH